MHRQSDNTFPRLKGFRKVIQLESSTYQCRTKNLCESKHMSVHRYATEVSAAYLGRFGCSVCVFGVLLVVIKFNGFDESYAKFSSTRTPTLVMTE